MVNELHRIHDNISQYVRISYLDFLTDLSIAE